MGEVGELFEKGIMQLPFVLQAAEVVKAALDILEPRLPKSEQRLRGSMVLATVKGDVHDIGKNLVDIILRSNGYRVVNLGTNQGGAEIAAAVEKHRPGHVGLSALLVRLHPGNGRDPAPACGKEHPRARDLRRGGPDPVFRGLRPEARIQGQGVLCRRRLRGHEDHGGRRPPPPARSPRPKKSPA